MDGREQKCWKGCPPERPGGDVEELEYILEHSPGDEPNSVDAYVVRFIHRYSSKNFKKFMALGIHPGQLPVLRVLQTQEGLSLREIAELLHIKPPTVTVTVKRLEKSGILYKEADPEDLRVSRIYMTEKGKAVGTEIQELLEENERTLTRGFSEAELAQLKDFLGRMTENMAEKNYTGKDRRPWEKF